MASVLLHLVPFRDASCARSITKISEGPGRCQVRRFCRRMRLFGRRVRFGRRMRLVAGCGCLAAGCDCFCSYGNLPVSVAFCNRFQYSQNRRREVSCGVRHWLDSGTTGTRYSKERRGLDDHKSGSIYKGHSQHHRIAQVVPFPHRRHVLVMLAAVLRVKSCWWHSTLKPGASIARVALLPSSHRVLPMEQ